MNFLLQQHEKNKTHYRTKHEKPRPWSFGKIYNSLTAVYLVAGTATRTPGDYYRIDRRTGRPTSKPLKNTHEYIHPSVRTRTFLYGPGSDDRGDYDSKAMGGWNVTVDKQNINRKQSVVVWRAPRSQKRAHKVLPESVLKETELRLLEKSPEMYDYLMQDPRKAVRR